VTEAALEPVLQQASDFANEVEDLLLASFDDAPVVEVTRAGNRVRIAPAGQSDKSNGVPLRVHGLTLAWLRIDFLCRLDAANQFMAIDRSKIWLVADVDNTPIFRFEYLYDADWVPHSHIQVHGQRGALSHLLSRTGHSRPHEMSALHLPTGGSRFRPALEDVIQFLVVDCKFDALESWEPAVLARRAALSATVEN
jgi:hypothetical protein